ncbi:MAG TPA: TIGR03560 family F420-dependent LLM class oxidoreductase [Candidatus Limnocylindrales bacterium]
MKVGLLIPQGWKGEYAGLSATEAWATSVRLATQAERLGFESIWLFDHFHTVPQPTDEITFEAFTGLAGLARATEHIRVGPLVACAGFRNPALVAKMASTLDVISGGRFELGLGAGWKQDEWLAYGFGFPALAERLEVLADTLEIVRRMLSGERATFEGRHASVRGAINVPAGLQRPRLPIMVGGNGRNVTWRLAARFADELNLVALTPAELREELPIVRQRCEEEGRDPASLPVSMYLPDAGVREPGQPRVDLLGELAALGLARIQAFPNRWGLGPEVLERFAEDVTAAGLGLDRPAAPSPPADATPVAAG